MGGGAGTVPQRVRIFSLYLFHLKLPFAIHGLPSHSYFSKLDFLLWNISHGEKTINHNIMNALPFPLGFVKFWTFCHVCFRYIFFKEIKQHARHNENSSSRDACSLRATTLLNSGYSLSMQTSDYNCMVPVFYGLAGLQASIKRHPVCKLLPLKCLSLTLVVEGSSGSRALNMPPFILHYCKHAVYFSLCTHTRVSPGRVTWNRIAGWQAYLLSIVAS